METKKTEIERFVQSVESLSTNLLDDSKGYVVFAYNELENSQENTFALKCKLHNMAECIYSCMTQNEGFANALIAAANAYVQNRYMAAAALANEQAPEEAPAMKKGRKRTKKTN